MADIEAFPQINLPDEQRAYGIRRYDRLPGNQRIHSEDFAQILHAYAHDKYRRASYDQIGKLLYRNSIHGQRDAIQMPRRLLVNILLANGDAHLKNWQSNDRQPKSCTARALETLAPRFSNRVMPQPDTGSRAEAGTSNTRSNPH
jgi:serine/threonine-protein kinase HipA